MPRSYTAECYEGGILSLSATGFSGMLTIATLVVAIIALHELISHRKIGLFYKISCSIGVISFLITMMTIVGLFVSCQFNDDSEFFNGFVEWLIIIYMMLFIISQLSLFFMFMGRLYFTFQNTLYDYSPRVYCAFIFSLALNLTLIFVFLTIFWIVLDNKDYLVTSMASLIILTLVESAILLVMFVRSLIKVR